MARVQGVYKMHCLEAGQVEWTAFVCGGGGGIAQRQQIMRDPPLAHSTCPHMLTLIGEP